MYIVIIIVVVCLLPFGFLAIQSVLASRPDDLGVAEGKLRPCPNSPNCVCTSSEDDKEHHMDAIPLEGTNEEAIARLKKALATLPRTEIITEKENYIHAESTSLIFRFVDDVEFFVDTDANKIHFRSASRVGYSDLGVNRARMEQLRKAYEESIEK
ncbi:MAG: DUF1499 domain-containing protein [Gemmataceae bacterium]